MPGHRYVIGADPAEGNPNSDDSATTVLDVESWCEVASLVGKFEPSVFAYFIDMVGRYFSWLRAGERKGKPSRTHWARLSLP